MSPRAADLKIPPPASLARRLDLGPIGDTLLAMLTVIDFVLTLTLPSDILHLGDYAALATASLAYILVGIYGWKRWGQLRSPGAALIYFAPQLLLGAFIVYWGYGSAWLLLLPLVSQSIELPRSKTLLVCLLSVVIIALPGLFPARILASGLLRADELSASILLTALEFSMAVFFVLLVSEIVARERQARADLAAAHRALGEYALQVEDLATLQERNRLAREIHDSLGHHLTAIHVHLEAAGALLANLPADDALPGSSNTSRAEIGRCLERAQSLTRDGLTDVRRALAALRASPLERRSLPEAIASLVGECRQTGIPAELTVTGQDRPLQPPVRQTLFRAAQEALTNVRKHSQASQVCVGLEYDDDVVRLAVQDDGLGAAQVTDGFGLLGLRERVQLLGGSVGVRTAPGEGFSLVVEIPA